jgi:hypothetical protein
MSAGDDGRTGAFCRPGDVARLVASDGIVNVSCANTGDDNYVSVAGRAALVEDASLKQKKVDVKVFARYSFGGS